MGVVDTYVRLVGLDNKGVCDCLIWVNFSSIVFNKIKVRLFIILFFIILSCVILIVTFLSSTLI